MKVRSIKIVVFILLILSGKSISAQEKNTIQFQQISFAEALQLSANTGKPVFIDCYTSWCAPCKKMEQTVFVNDSVYTFYNEHFINFKVDMEKGEGIELRKKYEVGSFPTYLFVDSKGEIVHRTASLMPVNEFLIEGRKALNPTGSFRVLKEKYEGGDRSEKLLLEYAVVLKKINRDQSQKVQKELTDKITDAELHSPFGWEVIENMSQFETDRLGKYLLQNKDYFKDIAGEKALQTVLNRLKMSEMYRFIRDNDSISFFRELKEMKLDKNLVTQRNVAMLETEYYLETNNVDSFVVVAKRAEKGILENNDMDLAFIARRALYKADGNKKILNESLRLARKAVVLNPEEYSNQGTLASVCLEMKLKKEGIEAATKARLLADQSTSKIQKIAQTLLDKIKALD